MSLNKLMHPRNIYKVPPDFKALAIKYPEFRKQVVQDLSGKIHLDFKDPEALRALTITLLKHDFGLDVAIPPSHLVPTIPQRLNYILWLEDLMSLLPKNLIDDGVAVRGIDIGTGACCIYPLLGSKKNQWTFLATEINPESVTVAQENADRNNLSDKIEILKVDPSSTLETILEGRDDTTYHFCMCNPPFFRDKHDANWKKKARTQRRTEPNAVKTGEEAEMIVEGGEVEFIKAIIQSSLKLKKKINIYTTLLGKKKSVQPVVDELLNSQISHTVTEFCQGKTMRWGVAWTFLEGVEFKTLQHKKAHSKPKPPLVYIIPSNISQTEYTLKAIRETLTKKLQEFQVQVKVMSENKNSVQFHLRSDQNTWSHQRRKRRELQRQTSIDAAVDKNSNEILTLPSTSKVNSLNKRKLDDGGTEPQKRHKGNDAAHNVNEIKNWLLSCELTLKQIGKNVALQMECCRDMESRETMHQIMQLIKNCIK